MPKRTNFVPNLRVDIDDLENATHTYSRSVNNIRWKRVLIDNYPRVSAGFRVEVPDQATNPGVVTIYNGFAFNRDGQLLLNEDAINTARSITLAGDATYYLEVEFTTTDTDSDARALWDPTFDNGLDTSGDELPDGREFSVNVATRVAEDWRIVDPVSTTGFEIDSDHRHPHRW